MIKLIINKPGLFLNIPGLQPFRTPAEVNITKVNLNLIKSELKKNGVTKYKIISDDSNNKTKTIKQDIKEEVKIEESLPTINYNNQEIIDKIANQHKIIERIEQLLQSFLNSGISENDTVVKKKKEQDETIEDFIPEINLSNTIKGSSETRKIKVKTDLSNIDGLKNIK